MYYYLKVCFIFIQGMDQSVSSLVCHVSTESRLAGNYMILPLCQPDCPPVMSRCVKHPHFILSESWNRGETCEEGNFTKKSLYLILTLTCLCHECTWPPFWPLWLELAFSWRVCLRRIWALDTDNPPNLLPPDPVLAWEILSFCRRGTKDSLKLTLLLLFSLFSRNEFLFSRPTSPSKLLAFAAISDLLTMSGRSLPVLFLVIESVSLEFSLRLWKWFGTGRN